jgi:D-alanine-D-alanine ligase
MTTRRVVRRKTRVCILCGGRSAEHEVSLQSARNIVGAIDKEKYDVVLIGIDKNGRWSRNEASDFLSHADDPELIRLKKSDDGVAVVPGTAGESVVSLMDRRSIGSVDVVFPVLHGPFGEDGTVQGLLKLLDVPFVGAGVLGSAAAMDKEVTKRLLRDAGVPTARFLVFWRSDVGEIDFHHVTCQLGLPVFVKPANLGSSVGINKAGNREQFEKAVKRAFEHEDKILVEEYIEGREIECSVLGNENPIASVPGEIIPRHEFYSYEAKYVDPEGAVLEIPARLENEIIHRVQNLAITTFKVLCCEGMARVDFLLRGQAEVIVNELNTIPGFTKISMYPKLWEASGVPYAVLIDRLIQLALERFEREKQKKDGLSQQ